MASVPEQLADRLIVVSREKYVRISDDNPAALSHAQVTIVPVPLLGKWHEFKALHNMNLIDGQAYISERAAIGEGAKPDSYILDVDSFDAVAKTKSRLVLGVCQALGATRLESVESSTQTDEQTVRDTLEASATQAAWKPHRSSRKTPSLSSSRQFSADLVNQVRERYVTQMLTQGHWRGGQPSVEAARRVIAGYDQAMVEELLMLIDQRESESNPVTQILLNGTLTSQLSRDFDLLTQAAQRFEGAFAGVQVDETIELRNRFERRKSQARETKFSLKVHFGEMTRAS